MTLEEGAPQARCPSGCGKQIDYRLPGVSKLLRSFLESAHATELDERRKDQEPEEAMPGGFDLWQEIAASRDLFVCGSLAVAFGSSGIVLAKSEEDRVKVKFDSFIRGASGVFNVSPEEIMPQLPSSFGVKIGQRVVAALDLVVRGAVAIPFATLGTVLGAGSSPDRITVLFDSAAEGFPSRLDIQAFEIAPSQELIGCGLGSGRCHALVFYGKVFFLHCTDCLCASSGNVPVSRNQDLVIEFRDGCCELPKEYLT